MLLSDGAIHVQATEHQQVLPYRRERRQDLAELKIGFATARTPFRLLGTTRLVHRDETPSDGWRSVGLRRTHGLEPRQRDRDRARSSQHFSAAYPDSLHLLPSRER